MLGSVRKTLAEVDPFNFLHSPHPCGLMPAFAGNSIQFRLNIRLRRLFDLLNHGIQAIGAGRGEVGGQADQFDEIGFSV